MVVDEKKKKRRSSKKIMRDMKLSFNVNAIEWNYIKTVAQIKGISVSDYIRRSAMQPNEDM